MLKKRWFRLLVSLVLVACILVNISPIKAKAVTPVALTGWAILALTAALGAGVVLNPATPQIANAIGEELSKTAQRVVPDGWETISKVCDHLDNMTPEWDPGDFHNDLKTALAGGLLTAITAMTVAAVADGVVNTEVEEEVTADDGYVYYNGIMVPDVSNCLNDYYKFGTICLQANGTYSFYADAAEPYWNEEVGRLVHPSGNRYFYWGSSSGDSWLGGSSLGAGATEGSIIWTNYDLKTYDGASYFSSSEPSSTKTSTTTVPVTPEIYVGDIPAQIENGEADEEKLNIPIIDPSKFVTSPDTAYEEITNVAQQMKDGTMTYNQYVNNYQYVPTTDPDPGTDPSEPSTSTEPSEPKETEPEEEEEKDLESFSLDLRDYFPFCIPFDIYKFLSILDAEPVTPHLEFDVYLPIVDVNWHLVIDLAAWDTAALLLRRLELLLFIVGLAMVTRNNYIRG